MVQDIVDGETRYQLRFRSRSEHTLDPKGRLHIPARFRTELDRVGATKLIVTNWDRCLRAYPEKQWLQFEEKLLALENPPPHFATFVRYVISGVTDCTWDKQGRIQLPPFLRTEFHLEKEVVVNGMLEHFEIWEKTAWDLELRQARAYFEEIQTGLSSMGMV